jgi:hypothetical protein
MTDKQSAAKVPTPDDISEALQRTGFILEYHTAQLLRKHEFHVEINSAFPDPESGKSREVDITAEIMHDSIGPDENISVAVELIIECKNSSNPLILIGEEDSHGRYTRNSIDIVSFDPLHIFQFSRDSLPSIQGRLGLNSIEVPGDRTFVGSQLLRMDNSRGRWQADNSSVYESILYPLAKSWQYEKNQWTLSEQDYSDNQSSEWDFPYFRYIIPIVVTAGPVFNVDMTSGSLEITEADWSRLRRDFNSKGLRMILKPDIVPYRNLEAYLQAKIVPLFDGALNRIEENTRFFNPEWLSENFGTPRYSETKFHEWLRNYRGTNPR